MRLHVYLLHTEDDRCDVVPVFDGRGTRNVWLAIVVAMSLLRTT